MKKQILLSIMLMVLVIFWGSSLFLAFGCMSAPKKIEDESVSCFLARDCLYRNQKNHDKSSCSLLIKGCYEDLNELRRINRMNYCNNKLKRPVSMNWQACWDKLE